MSKPYLKKITKLLIILIILTFTINVNAAFTEPTTAPSSSDQDFPQNILGANNNNNDFDSTNVTANNDGSLIERLEYIITSLSSLWTKVGNLLYYNTGNVGIGTSTPSALLEVSGDGQSALKVTDVTNSITTGIWSGTTQGSIGTLTNTDLRFLTNGTSKMTIDTSGNVGVGTTSTESYRMRVHEPTLNRGQFAFSNNDNVEGQEFAKISFNALDSDSNDQNYTAISNTIVSSTNGSESGMMYFEAREGGSSGARMVINGSNIGIGTTTPGVKLDIQGTGAMTGATGTTQLRILGTGNDYINAGIVLQSGDDSADIRGGGLYLYQQVGQKEWFIGSPYNDSDSLIIARKTDVATHDTGVADNPNALFKITSTGNVGIGTIGPATKLHVMGTNALPTSGSSGSPNGGLLVGSDSTNVVLNVGVFNSGSGGSWLQSRNNGVTGQYTLLLNPDGGNVGIGTTGPGAKLHVSGGYSYFGDNPETADNTMRGFGLIPYSDGNLYADFKTYSGGTVYFRTGEGTETGSARTWMAVDPTSGNVGIGTAAPQEKLEITGGMLSNNKKVWTFTSTANGSLAYGHSREYIFTGLPNGGRLVLELIITGSFGGASSGVTSKKIAVQFSPWSDGMYSVAQSDVYALGFAPSNLTIGWTAVGSGSQYKMTLNNTHGSSDFTNFGATFTFYSNGYSFSNPTLVSVTDI